MQTINVLLVDDHELVLTGINALLNAVDGISVVAVANCGEQALLFTERLSPDVVIMDVNMPGIGGAEACRRIIEARPNIKVIALSAHNDGFIPEQLFKLGAMGFISKNTGVDEMVEAIRTVMFGKTYVSPDVAQNIVQNYGNSPFSQLSKRETEVVGLILQGCTIQEMSQMLGLKDKTINTFRYRLYEKLNVKNDVELTRLAVKFKYTDSCL